MSFPGRLTWRQLLCSESLSLFIHTVPVSESSYISFNILPTAIPNYRPNRDHNQPTNSLPCLLSSLKMQVQVCPKSFGIKSHSVSPSTFTKVQASQHHRGYHFCSDPLAPYSPILWAPSSSLAQLFSCRIVCTSLNGTGFFGACAQPFFLANPCSTLPGLNRPFSFCSLRPSSLSLSPSGFFDLRRAFQRPPFSFSFSIKSPWSLSQFITH